MLRGLTTAASGMLTDERMQQLLANNLANLQTPGFKASNGEMLQFPQQLLEMMNYGSDAGVNVGKMGTGVVFQEGIPMFLEGQLSKSNRALDVAIVDNTPAGNYAVVNNGTATSAASPGTSVQGTITAGAGGRLQVNGQPLAVLNSSGQILQGIYAAKNPNYQGTALFAADGMPDYDANGNPSYVFVNANNTPIGAPGQTGFEGTSIRIGNQDDMGNHSFYAVAFQSTQGQSGIALTKDGHFTTNAQGELVDSAGNAILPIGANGMPIQNARIYVNTAYTGTNLFAPDGSPVTDSTGQPSYEVRDTNGNRVAGKLGVVNADVTQLSPMGQTEFIVGGTLNPTQVISQLSTGTGAMKPGELEESTVDPTATMTQMLAVIAQYQANQEVIRSEDSLLDKAVNDVGHVNL